jgi:F0F1-type ATP synthase assembly protein I
VSLVFITSELSTRKNEEEKQSKRKSSNEHKSLSLASHYLIGIVFGLGRGFDLFGCVLY